MNATEIWMAIWKWVFVVGVSLFAIMAVYVTIGGVRDIKRLFRRLDEAHARDEQADRTEQ